MATEKDVFTPEIRASMKADYEAAGKGLENEAARAAVVTLYATNLGKSEHAVRGIMSRSDYYISKVRKAKNGVKAERKEKLVEHLVEMTGINPVKLETLENANKLALQELVKFIESVTTEPENEESETES